MGQSVERHGVPNASHWSATGLTVSGLEETSIMSILLFWMRSPATVAARLVSDWLSCISMLTGCFLPSPHRIPSGTAAFHLSRIHLSGMPKSAAGPVRGETVPNLSRRPVSAAADTVVVAPSVTAVLLVTGAAVVLVAGAAVVVVDSSVPQAARRPPKPPAPPTVAPVTPAILRNSRRLSGVGVRSICSPFPRSKT